MGTGGSPPWYQTAVCEATSTVRGRAPYQVGVVSDVQAVRASAQATASVGRRAPLSRGRPLVRGPRSGAGA